MQHIALSWWTFMPSHMIICLRMRELCTKNKYLILTLAFDLEHSDLDHIYTKHIVNTF